MRIGENASDLLAARLRRQRLAGPPSASPVAAVRDLLAVQAQDHVPALWSVSLRAGDPTASQVQADLDSGAIVRVHVLRPTWHLLAAEDLAWLQAVTGPRVRARYASFYRRLGIDDDALARSRQLMRTALAGGNELTMAELGQVLGAGGMTLGALHLTHLVMDLELRGELCSGPRHGKQHSYMLTADRVPGSPPLEEIDVDDALRRLVERYIAGHGPATVKDLQAWSSLTLAALRAAIADLGDELDSFETDGRIYYVSQGVRAAPDGGDGQADDVTPDPPAPGGAAPGQVGVPLWLLQQFDELAIGYRESRDALGAAAFVSQVNPEHSDYFNPIVAADGIVGWWRPRATAREVEFDITGTQPAGIDPAALAREQDRYRAFRLG